MLLARGWADLAPIDDVDDGPTPTFAFLAAALGTALAPETRARARAVAATIRTDGATVAAKLLLDMIGMAGMAGMTGREKPRMSA